MWHFEGAVDQVHSVVIAQAQISQKNVDRLSLQHIDGSSDICGDVDIIIVLEQTPQAVARMLLVVDDKDGRWMEFIAACGI